MGKIFAGIKKALEKPKTILVCGHIDPDGDAIGSVLALGFLLKKFNKKVILYCEEVPRVYQFLPGAKEIQTQIVNQHFDLVITVDSSDLSRIGKKIDLKQLADFVINIDHHPDNSQFGDINYIEKISSVAEQIYKLIKFLKVKIDKNIAQCLYVALITDTGNFRYENTLPSTFAMAADLIRAGVNTHQLTTQIYDTKSLSAIKISALVLNNLETSQDGRVAWAVVTRKMMEEAGARGEDLMGLVDRIRAIEGVEVAVLFKEEKEQVKINFRSKERVDVSAIARKFGGGGHTKAAGAIIPGALAEVKNKVIGEIS